MATRRTRSGAARLVLAAGLALLAACAAPRARVDRGLEGGSYFLCCTLHFNRDREASDAGYVYDPRTTFPAGTQVQVVRDGGDAVTLQPVGDGQQYKLYFRFGRKVITAGQYFQEVLLRDDPRPQLARTPEVAAAVAHGELRTGMTKAEAVAARGYPPRHRTSGVEADDWIYYQNAGAILRVRFQAGSLTEITYDRAP